MKKFQEYSMKNSTKRGISIECNPTSNIKIGLFSKYYNHPITRFNSFYLENDNPEVQLKVSINKDDLGAFDT